jgi:hypothetical protein
MATRTRARLPASTITVLTDDLDGGDAGQTVEFGLDG